VQKELLIAKRKKARQLHQQGWSTDAPAELRAMGIRWELCDDPELLLWDRYNNKLVREEIRWKGVDLRLAVEEDYPDA